MSKVTRAPYHLNEKEDRYYKRHKKLIDAIVQAYNLLSHDEGDNNRGNEGRAYRILRDVLPEGMMKKLIAKRFWENAERASKEVAKWPAWKRGRTSTED
jgi:hypothetical protein